MAKHSPHVDHITDAHVERFVRKLRSVWDNDADEALTASGIINGCGCPHIRCEHEKMYMRDQDAILARTYELARPAIGNAFRQAAEEVLGV